jgi:3-oxoacyl-[acyl-carrier-protein] synthase II
VSGNGNGRRRVAITGIGAITPIGLTREGLWDGLRAERSAVRAISRFDPSIFRSHIAAEVNDFVAADHMETKRAKRLDRFGQFSVAAARMAVDDARLDLPRENRERIGAMMGSALGGVGYAEEQLGNFITKGLRSVDAMLALAVFGGASSCNIAIEFGVSGPNSTNAMSCASGTMAIGEALRQIRHGYADVMIAGGAEAPLAPLCFGAFALIRDKDRDGFVMGEAGCVLVLEEWERAKSRGAPVYAELCGYGTTNDAHHMTAPLPGGAQAARAMRLALDDAHLAPTEIGYVNAHGSSTPLNDPSETLAIRQVLGDHASRVLVSGTKGYYGHALGASGAVEAAICALAMERGWLPPTVNLSAPDPACDLNYLPLAGRDEKPEHMISNSFGFGGINASLVLRRAS